MDATLRLAQFTHDLTYEDLPEAAVQAACRVALDTVGSALAATDAPAIRELAGVLTQFSTGPSRVWVTGERLSPPSATLMNSSMAHALELDDLHSELPMHCGVVIVPAALAVAEARPGVTGKEIVVALVAGAEILCRLARANRSYRGTAGFRGFNPTSIVAGFAASAIAARLMGLDAAGIARAMGLSYAQASGNQQTIADGGLVKRMQPGLVAEAGVRAAWFAEAGITGAIDAIEGKNGYFAVYEMGEYDPDCLHDGLGESFEIEKMCFKRFPVCGMAQPTMDSYLDLVREHGFSGQDVAKVSVEGSKFVNDMVGRPYRPGAHPEVDAQFNLPYCLATLVETGGFGMGELAPEKTLDPDRRKRADAIAVTLDPSLKGKWEARVNVTLNSGASLSATRKKAAWQDDRPMTDEELLAKFFEGAARAEQFIPRARAEGLADELLGLAGRDDLSTLIASLST